MPKTGPAYFRYAPPEDYLQGPAQNAHIGEVIPGGVYEIPAHLVAIFQGSPDWQPASKSELSA